MTTKTFEVPNIGCAGCVQAITNELSDLEGVASVSGDVSSRTMHVEYAPPATWEGIVDILSKIDYPPVAG
ncbi:MAG: cation transporter [Chloroflexi bacterium]|nr:cation transporter [Chloroflexota bacterium]